MLILYHRRICAPCTTRTGRKWCACPPFLLLLSLFFRLSPRPPQVDKEGGVNVEDAAGFFANVFGGERFMDYVRPFPPSFFLYPRLSTLKVCRSEKSRL